jgi:thioredoxin-related protein
MKRRVCITLSHAVLVVALLLAPGCRRQEAGGEPGGGATPDETDPVGAEQPVPSGGRDSAAEVSGAWMTDFDAAMAVAAEEGKDILLNFSGSDWCGWCIRLDAEVFEHREFIEAARQDFVLVVLDFPNKPENKAKISAVRQERNAELKEAMGARGFPSVFLTDAAGVPYAQTGYLPGGPADYFKHLQKLRADKAKKDRLVKELANPAVKGLDRAQLLNAIIEATPAEIAAKQCVDYMREIVVLDPDNTAGFKLRYQVRLREVEAKAAMAAKDYEKATKIYEMLIEELKPTGQDLQDLWLDAGEPYFNLRDLEGVRKCLENALAAAPEGEQVQRINRMMEGLFPEPEEQAGAGVPEAPQ